VTPNIVITDPVTTNRVKIIDFDYSHTLVRAHSTSVQLASVNGVTAQHDDRYSDIILRVIATNELPSEIAVIAGRVVADDTVLLQFLNATDSDIQPATEGSFQITVYSPYEDKPPFDIPFVDVVKPSTPTGLTATVISSTEIDVSWDAASDNVGVAGYEFFKDGISQGTTTDIIWHLTGLISSTEYNFYLYAYDDALNYSDVSATIQATTSAYVDTLKPSAPSNLTAITFSSSVIDLAWDPSSDNILVTGYKIYQDTVAIDLISNFTSYRVSGLSENTTYDFNVTALDAAVNESDQSNTATATTDANATLQTVTNSTSISIGPDIGAGSPYPSEITISGMSNTVTKVTCQLINFSHVFTRDVEVVLQAPDTTKYCMLMGDVGNLGPTTTCTLTFDMAATQSLPGTALVTGTYLPTNIETGPADSNLPSPAPVMPYPTDLNVFNGISPNGVWKLFVWDDGAGDAGSIAGGWSLSVTSPGGGEVADVTLPSAPTNVTGTAIDSTTIRIDWSASTDNIGVVGYKLLANGAQVGTTTTELTFTHSGLTQLTPYTHTVRAYDAAGNNSVDSTAVVTSTPAAPAGIYVATTGNDTTGTGSLTQPYKTIAKGLTMVPVGGYVYVRAGTYAITASIVPKSGTAGNLVHLFAYPGERPVIDGSGQPSNNWGFYGSSKSYFHLKGFDVKNCTEGGFRLDGASNYNIIENCDFSYSGRLGTAGTRGTGVVIYNSSANNQIINCDSHHNRSTSPGDSDGFQISTTGTGNSLTGCRSWLNSDDGYDTFCVQDNLSAQPVTLTNCWSWKNGYAADGTTGLGNGTGFKLGGRRSNTTGQSGGNILKRCLAFQNKDIGINENSANTPNYIYNCTSSNNVGQNYYFPGTYNSGTASGIVHVLKNNLSYLGTTGNVAASNDTFNSWNLAVTVNSSDFVSTDPATAQGARQADGSLPATTYLNLVVGSDLINAGTIVSGVTYADTAPDLGAFEYGSTPPPPVIFNGRVYLIGDSTVSYEDSTRAPRQGWGKSLTTKLATKAPVVNLAESGASAKTYLNNTVGNWTAALAAFQAGDYVFIQLGHNDENDSTSGEYKTNITTMVTASKAKGAVPVLVTSVTRRSFSGTTVVDNHAYVPKLYEISTEQSVEVIQLYETSMALVQSYGVEGSKQLYLYTTAGQYPYYPSGVSDNTHFQEFGADKMSDLIIAEINRLALSGISA